jgi:hypothetical protein
MSVANASVLSRHLLALLGSQAEPLAALLDRGSRGWTLARQMHTLPHQLQQQQQQQHQQQHGVHSLSMSEAQDGDTKPLNLCNAVNEALHQAMDSNDK